MTAGWVAASTRGRALARRLVGPAGAGEIASAATWDEARSQLAKTLYGAEIAPNADRAAVRRAAAVATSWQLRVLAGWLPVGSSGLARVFAAPIEIANIEAHLAGLAGAKVAAPVPLGPLSVAWPRVTAATSPEQVRISIARSAWGDPGGSSPTAVAVGLRTALARRLISQIPEAAPLAKGGLAVLIARESFAFERQIAPITSGELDRLIGSRWRQATTIPELTELLPDSSAWALSGITSAADLWRAELAVAARVANEAAALASERRFTKSTVAATMALLLVDLWRISAAIEVAGRGPIPIEVFDAVA